MSFISVTIIYLTPNTLDIASKFGSCCELLKKLKLVILS